MGGATCTKKRGVRSVSENPRCVSGRDTPDASGAEAPRHVERDPASDLLALGSAPVKGRSLSRGPYPLAGVADEKPNFPTALAPSVASLSSGEEIFAPKTQGFRRTPRPPVTALATRRCQRRSGKRAGPPGVRPPARRQALRRASRRRGQTAAIPKDRPRHETFRLSQPAETPKDLRQLTRAYSPRHSLMPMKW